MGFERWQDIDLLQLSEDRAKLWWKPSSISAIHTVKQPTSIASSLGFRQWQLVLESTDRDDLIFNTDDEGCFNAWAHALSVFCTGLQECGAGSSCLLERGLGMGELYVAADAVEANPASSCETRGLLDE